MRYLLIIALCFISAVASAQVTAKQIRVDSLYGQLQVLSNDTTTGSTTYKLGRWRRLVDVLTALNDKDWIKARTTAGVPANTDTMYHVGPVLIGDDTIHNISGGWGKAALNVVGRIDARFPNYSGTNMAIGYNVLPDNYGGLNNIGIGSNILPGATGADYNIGIGANVLQSGTSGDFNIAIGSNAMNLATGTGAQRNIAIGADIGANTGGTITGYNVIAGHRAVYNGCTSYNTIFGYQAGHSKPVSNNVFIGASSGYTNTGTGNIFIGYQSGYNETGSNWLYIDNSNTSNPLIEGNMSADTLLVNGRLGYTTDAGNPDRLAGLDNTQFTSVILGYGLDFANDTLYVDTTGFGGSGGSGSTNLTITGSGPTYAINSSSGTDVYVLGDGMIDITELSPDTLYFKADTVNWLATIYDVNNAAADDDWYEVGTTDPPNGIADTMYHLGITAIGMDSSAAMYGQLNIGWESGTDIGIAITGYESSAYPFLATYPLADYDNGWEFATEDDMALLFREKVAGVGVVPFAIESGAPVSSLYVQGDGDVQVYDYPNTRDDGTAANFLGTDANGVIQSFDIDDVISEWYLVATGTAGAEAIMDADTARFAGAGITSVTRSGNTITITSTEGDGSATNEAWIIDGNTGGTELVSNQTILFSGAGINTTDYNATTNTLLITGTEVDGSVINELNTIEVENVSVQANNSNIDFQTLFDVATDGAGEVNVLLDMGESTTVTAAESDDYMLMWDSGLAQHQKMLWSEFIIDLITFKEDNAIEGTGAALDFATGIDLSMTGSEAEITLDFNEFTTDAATEGDEYVILYDPSAATQEKTLITTITDSNFAEDNLTFTGNRSHDMSNYTLELHGAVNNFKLKDDNGGSGDNIIITSELGTSTGITGGISFEYDTLGTAKDIYDIEANKRSGTKQTLEIQAEYGTDAHITYEKNAGFSDNTTESHLSINGGISFSQNYEWTGTASDLTLDRSFYNVLVTGSGAIGDEIFLPELISNADNWQSTMTDAQAQVGQVYVITNYRNASVNLGIVPFAGDNINGSGSTLVLTNGKSAVIRAVRLSSGTGYWQTWTSD